MAWLARPPKLKAGFGVSAALVLAGVALDAGVPSEKVGAEVGAAVEAGGLREKEGPEVVFGCSAGLAPPREKAGVLVGAI